MNWEPVKHTVVKNEIEQNLLSSIGYVVSGNIGSEQISVLKKLYHQYHNVAEEKGGMFYSLYSLDLEYRQNVHNEIGEIMRPLYDDKFKDYKVVINSFIVKYKGKESAFSLHQDSTSLDEYKYSPLSVWIPLVDTTINNGCLCVVPKSQKIFYPYRGISFPTPFNRIEETVAAYLQPIELKAGDVLLFDNRMVHFSPTNNSNEDRIVVMSGIFPEKAKLEVCYKDGSNNNAPIEIYEQDDDFLLMNKTFYHNCTDRPVLGKKIKSVNMDLPEFSTDEFENIASKMGLIKYGNHLFSNQSINIISEPKIKEQSFFKKISNWLS